MITAPSSRRIRIGSRPSDDGAATAGALYRQAAAAQWDPGKEIDWDAPFELHPDIEGYRRMAEALDPAIVAALAQGPRRP